MRILGISALAPASPMEALCRYATIAESEIKARLRKGPGLYFFVLPESKGEWLDVSGPIFLGHLPNKPDRTIDGSMQVV
jgi:hypothetical protein